MPLIRYDTGDLAEAAGGPCACGRTLPSFGDVAGRYRRFAGLPAGTRQRVYALLGAFDEVPWEMLAFLRRYQIHQDRDNRFTLRVQTTGPIPDAFREHIGRAWEPVAGEPPCALAIVAVDAIGPSPGGKLLDFASDFYTDAFAAWSTGSPA
jgi:phenylacetate-CoA ligase